MISKSSFKNIKIGAMGHVQSAQSGVTLILALLVMTAMAVIVLSFAAIAVNEIRVSGDLVNTEPAVTAAEAGGEDVLYYSIRGFTGSVSADCTAPTVSTLTNGVILTSCINYYYQNPYTFDMAPNEKKTIYLYDPANQLNTSPGYTNVTVAMNFGTSGALSICSWTYANCGATGDIVSNDSFSPGQNRSYALNGSLRYQLVLTNGACSTNCNGNYTLTGTPKGLPAGVTTILTQGSFKGQTRKIQTTLPQ